VQRKEEADEKINLKVQVLEEKSINESTLIPEILSGGVAKARSQT